MIIKKILLLSSLLQIQAASLNLTSPLDYQVIQRETELEGVIPIEGQLKECDLEGIAIEVRLSSEEKSGKWLETPAKFAGGVFTTNLKAPAGGWYRLEVRAKHGDLEIAVGSVEHLGVGEVFVVAGQSNSANHGSEKQVCETGQVTTFDGKSWKISNDPQSGASGDGGSFMPPLGDEISRRFKVPVGFVACGVGATSVRHWLPKGMRSPNPPSNDSTSLPNGEWESDGDLYNSLVTRMKSLGTHGFRTVLWHQGENDANQPDPTKSLNGRLYREFLEKIIENSRRDIGWDAPWFVAQASYHVLSSENSPDIRLAQAALWKDGIALEGPDTDNLQGIYRAPDGVHFSDAGLKEHSKQWLEKIAPWLAERR